MVSYDLFKAYDCVNVDFLVEVLARMGFGAKFIGWIRMLHKGANIISDLLSAPVLICLVLPSYSWSSP